MLQPLYCRRSCTDLPLNVRFLSAPSTLLLGPLLSHGYPFLIPALLEVMNLQYFSCMCSSLFLQLVLHGLGLLQLLLVLL